MRVVIMLTTLNPAEEREGRGGGIERQGNMAWAVTVDEVWELFKHPTWNVGGGGEGEIQFPDQTEIFPCSHWYKCQVPKCNRSDMSPDWGAH
jgi:hypothetical protein